MKQSIEIEEIFDEDIVVDSSDVTLTENLSIIDIIVDKKTNDNILITNVDESTDKNLCQDINNKHQIVREVINETSSNNLKAPTTESQSIAKITKNVIDKDISKVKSKGNKSFQDVQVKLVNSICDSVIEGLDRRKLSSGEGYVNIANKNTANGYSHPTNI